ncbi:hypothetical protein OE88DRAFT_1651955 [Heliocybe sulcata]|uniref:Transmembrane protein n=1 Tax=Heliocybe sulcata TaxID=5364 RepID=A0A5C3NPH9_9AGAM|nr:hypothetical protein OE88DRAFT_1651955 [Heliocybe sulcata]
MYLARSRVLWIIYYLCCSVFAQSLAQNSSDVALHTPLVTVYPTSSSALTSVAGIPDHASSSRSTLHLSATSHHTPVSAPSSNHTTPITMTRVPAPIVTNHPPNPQMPHPSPRPDRNLPRGPSAGVIVGAALGSLASIIVLASFARCLYTWRKQPDRDRIAEVVDRYQVQREMEEMAREDLEALRESVRRAPSPPPLPLYNDSRLPAYTPARPAADADV